jgi:hypothetical protein
MTSRIIAFAIAAALALLPASGLADSHEKKSQAGGKAAEHRSERAAERSNAQWDTDSTKGPDRAAEVKGESAAESAAAPEQATPDVAAPTPEEDVEAMPEKEAEGKPEKSEKGKKKD